MVVNAVGKVGSHDRSCGKGCEYLCTQVAPHLRACLHIDLVEHF